MSFFMQMGNAAFAPILMTLQKTPLQGCVCMYVHVCMWMTSLVCVGAYTTLHVATSPRLGNDSDRPSMTGNSNMHFTDITER